MAIPLLFPASAQAGNVVHTGCLDLLMPHTAGSMPGPTLRKLLGVAVDIVIQDFALCSSQQVVAADIHA